MRCIIPANHVKVFAKAIHCLAKLGSEIYLECLEHELEMKTVNASRSMFACVTFLANFFDRYESLPIYEEENELLRCKISVKTFLQVFRSITSIERSVESCEISLSADNCQLIFTLKCKHSIVKTYRLNFQECESLKAVFTKDLCPNKLTSPCKLLMDVLINFPPSLEEISLNVNPCKVTLSSFTEENEVGKVMSTEMNLHPEEFEYFQIGVDTNIAFCLKDLRAILGFAETCNSGFKLNFEHGGKPLVLSLGQENVLTANFVLATICDDSIPSNHSFDVSMRDGDPAVARKRQKVNTNGSEAKRKKADHSLVSGCGKVSSGASTLNGDTHSTSILGGRNLNDNNCCRIDLTEEDNLEHAVHSAYVRDVFFSDESLCVNNNTILAADSDEDT